MRVKNDTPLEPGVSKYINIAQFLCDKNSDSYSSDSTYFESKTIPIITIFYDDNFLHL